MRSSPPQFDTVEKHPKPPYGTKKAMKIVRFLRAIDLHGLDYFSKPSTENPLLLLKRFASYLVDDKVNRII